MYQMSIKNGSSSNKSKKSAKKNKNRVKNIEINNFVYPGNDNIDSKIEEKISLYSLNEDDKNIVTKRSNRAYETTTQSFNNSKEISFKCTKKSNIENNRYGGICQNKTAIVGNNNPKIEENKEKDYTGDNKEKFETLEEKESPVNNNDYYSIDFNPTNSNIYLNYFNEHKKNGDKNDENKFVNKSNIITFKYSLHKDMEKYISFFTDE